MIKNIWLVSLICLSIFNFQAAAIVPAAPGVSVPQIIIDTYSANPDRFMPTPGQIQRMENYRDLRMEAAQWGIQYTDDVSGNFPVICGKYSDSGPDDWPISQMQTQLFDGPWPTGTMRDFYHEVSFNQYHLDGEVFGWYTTTLTQQYVVGNEYGFGNDAHVGEFLIQLLNWADPYVNFGLYDNDGPDNVPNSGDDDGIVDTIFFIHDGAGGETGAQNIWSHSSSMQWAAGGYFYTTDPRTGGGTIKIGPYIIQPSINSNMQIIEIGVFCHEFGHALGLPDLYDTDYSSNGVGDWCLMSGGSWNTPARPAHFSAWCRYMMGWITPIEVQTFLHDQPIPMIETTGTSYKVWTDGNYSGDQYFMVENRQRWGSDINLKGEGLLVWHVDESAQQSNENHPKVDLEEADGLNNLYYAANSGDAGDPFPGSSVNRQFDEMTNPNSNDYFNNPTQTAVWNISDNGDTMYANLDAIYSQPLLNFLEFGIDDASGDNDGRADPGETVQLWVRVENYWAAANSLIGFLSSEADYITIDDATGVFGNIPSQGTGSNQANPFTFTVHEDAIEGFWPEFSVHFTAPGGFEQDFTMELMIGTPPILVVDDDLGMNYQDYLVTSLNDIYALYEVYDVSVLGPTTQLDFSEYEAIVWITGNDAATTLNTTEMTALQSYIDNGGTLILSGQNINEDIGNTGFFTNYLKCSPQSNTVGQMTLAGDAANPLSAGMNFLLIGATGAGNQTSASSVIPMGIAQSMFKYPNTQVGGVNYYNSANGAHVVYLAFGLEAVSGLGGTTSRASFLEAVFDWAGLVLDTPHLQSAPVIPKEFALGYVYPNPFNNSAEVSFKLPVSQAITLKVFDLLGRETAVLTQGRFNPGEHKIIWNAGNLASGVYIINLQGEEASVSMKAVLIK